MENNVKKYHEDDLREIVWDDHPTLERVDKELTDRSRWAVHYAITFKDEGRFYQFNYDDPATERQEGQDTMDVDGNGMVECYEVKPVKKTITVYERMK